jgi:hypothetical protein
LQTRIDKPRNSEAQVQRRKLHEGCGEAPERSAWDGIYRSVERAFKEVANDPDFVDFASCKDVVLKNPPACWVTTCAVSAKNGFGARVLRLRIHQKHTRIEVVDPDSD